MSILGIVVIVLLILFACYLVQAYVNPPFKTPILAIIVALALIWILSVIVPGINTTRVP